MKTKLLFSLLLTFSFSFSQGTGEVVITEIHNRPNKPTQQQLDAALLLSQNTGFSGDMTPNEGHTEWFEIYNTTGSPVVMDGWTITDASSSSNVTTIGSFTLAANTYAWFTGFYIPDAQGGLVPDYVYDYKKPSFNNESTYSGGSTTNCPDGVIIKKGDGTLVDQVLYDYGYGSYIVGGVSNCANNPGTTAYGFPGQGSSSKTTFMLNVAAPKTAAANDDPSNWSYSTLTYDGDQFGTPGKANDQDATLSVDNKFFNSFKIYPNPAKNYIVIESQKNPISKIEVFDVLGKSVTSQTQLSNDNIDISNLSRGMYFLKIYSDKLSITKKIIKE